MTLLLALLLTPLALVTMCFTIEVVVGLKPLAAANIGNEANSKAVIIVPAHNEQAVLGARLPLLSDAAEGQARILFVADNCTDSTADIARSLGAEVIERLEPNRRGKGFALDFAKQHLQHNPPDVVLIIDADCMTDRDSVGALIGGCLLTRRPCQATNLQMPAREASPAVQLSTFAFFIKNVIRQRGLQRLAGRAHLCGTGMALPWLIFERAELATGNIAEDLKLGLELAEKGCAPLFVEQATVWSNAESDANTMSQRRRWEGGFLHNAKRAAPRMLAQAFRCADVRLAWAAMDLMIPPFALLVMIDVLALAIAGPLTWLGWAQLWPLICSTGALALAFASLALAWAKGGSRFVSLKSLAKTPLYVAWKLPMYVGFARRGAPKEWLRTGRS